jgi:hypothetical protein
MVMYAMSDVWGDIRDLARAANISARAALAGRRGGADNASTSSGCDRDT